MTAPRCHFAHHVPYEGPGRIRAWAEQRGFGVTATWQHLGQPLPDLKDLNLIVVTGGPMSIHDEKDLPWLAEEKTWIRQALDQEIPIMGICLGAQLIADALGATVAPMGHQEIGWYPIRKTPEAARHPLLEDIPDPTPVLHWHGDRFEIPDGTIRLWESERCDHQAFFAKNILGLQFHLEMGPEEVNAIIDASQDELIPFREGVQSPGDMRNAQASFESTAEVLTKLLNRWWEISRKP